jgi:hypothetical protein
MPDPTAPVPVSVESEGNDGFRFEQRPTAPVTAEGSYEWYRREVERLRAEVERLADFGLKERERHEAKLASLQAFADRCREKDWAYAAERTRRAVEAEAERDALKAARCPSCDHLTGHHQQDGCWYAVTTGFADRDLVCPCALAAPDAPTTEEETPNG